VAGLRLAKRKNAMLPFIQKRPDGGVRIATAENDGVAAPVKMAVAKKPAAGGGRALTVAVAPGQAAARYGMYRTRQVAAR